MKDLLPIVVMTFNESSKIALEPYHSDLFLNILNSAERERKLKREGVEEFFSSQFASLMAEDLKNYFDGEVIIFSPVEDEKGKISSTRIRQAILNENVKEAGELLGAPLPSRGMWFMVTLMVVRYVIQQLIWCF